MSSHVSTEQAGIALETLERWRYKPVSFVEELFGVTPDPWQREALEVFPNVERLAFKACKGPGKTAVEAWLILNFLTTRPKSKVNATSITGDNLSSNLWPELGKWIDKAPFLGSLFEHTASAVRHKQFPLIWYALARTWPKKADKEAQADSMAGLHADYAMWVFDESGGIPESVLVSAEAVLASGIECKIVQGGNPTHLQGSLFRACRRDRHLWHVVTITGDPDNPKRSSRIKIEWARQQIASYGRDNPWVMVNVLGEFPPQSLNSLLSDEDVERAINRRLKREQYEWVQKRLGIDVARFGDDRTVLFPRQGLQVYKPAMMRNVRTTAIAARAMQIEQNWLKGDDDEVLLMVDDTGHWGHGVIDNLITSGRNCIPVVYHEKALKPQYKNRRTEGWLDMAEAIKKGAALPDIPELRVELTEPTYTYVNGAIALEEKDQIKARLGFSPDYGDALANTYMLPDVPARNLTPGGHRRSSRARTSDDIVD